MKPRRSNQRNQALTIIEVLIVIAILAVLSALLLPAFFAAMGKAQKTNCYNNLRQIDISFLVWADDYNGKFPMEVSVTNGGTMELVATGNVAACFQVMSNELSTPKILLCPEDKSRVWATNYSSGFDNSHISYFVGVAADTNHHRAFLAGDDNFAIEGVAVKSGLLQISTNIPIVWNSRRHVSPNSHFWTAARDRFVGNILFDDGSVKQTTSSNLCQLFHQTGLATNRLAIP